MDEPEEGDEALAANVQWVVSSAACRRLHLLSLDDTDVDTTCGRVLRRPESGSSIEAALRTGRSWSPRCFSLLPSALQKEWEPPAGPLASTEVSG